VATVRLVFGECVLDAEARLLVRAGQPVHLTTKAFDLLCALAARRPRVLSKAEAHALLWADVHVSEANLPNLVTEVRAALGDDARSPRFVRTVHGIGYAFCGEAQAPGASPPAGDPPFVYRLEWAGGLIALAEGEYLLGRHPESVVPTSAAGVSRRHARLRIAGGQAVLEDLGSRHGTFLAERRLSAPATLASGDRFWLGPLAFTLLVSREDFSETRDPLP
jgi:DNA-binding winged helix-turn-helix (wHTH) protein